MPQYESSHLDNGLIYNLSTSVSHASVGELFSSFRDFLVDRDKTSQNPNNTILRTNYHSHVYHHNFFNNKKNYVYPSVYELKAVISPASSYFNQLSSHYISSHVNFNDFYPIAVRYTDGKNIWLIERPPFLANIDYKNSRSSWDGKQKEYSIWMPWTTMLLVSNPNNSYYDAHLFFNDGPITSLDQYAVPCIFPNIYGDGRMCLNQTSIGLQQHVAATGKFDISTIYNYIINDYMTGGWNTDLGIQVFDRLVQFSKTAQAAKRKIVHGDSDQKKVYPSAITAAGRISTKKYIPNFINYFSRSSLDEINTIISEAKQTMALNNNGSFKTYSDVIDTVSKNFSNNHLYSNPLNNPNPVNYIYVTYRLLCDIEVSKTLDEVAQSQDNTYEFELFENLIHFIKSDLESDIQSLQQDSSYSSYAPGTRHIYVDDSKTIFTLDPNVHDKEFFNSKYPILNEAVQNA